MSDEREREREREREERERDCEKYGSDHLARPGVVLCLSHLSNTQDLMCVCGCECVHISVSLCVYFAVHAFHAVRVFVIDCKCMSARGEALCDARCCPVCQSLLFDEFRRLTSMTVVGLQEETVDQSYCVYM